MTRYSRILSLLFVPALAGFFTLNANAQATVLPQFAFGGGWYSALYFTNNNGSTVAFTVNFVSDTGTPLVVPSVNGSSASINLAAHGSTLIEAPNSGDLVEGYASFNLPAGVTGYGVFRHSVSGQPDQEAVVPFSSALATSTTLIWDDTNLITGVSIVNPSTTANTVAVTLWDENGSPAGTSSIPLPAGNKTAALLYALPGLGGIGGKRGSAQFSVTSGSVAVLGLRANGPALTSIPTATGTAAAGPSVLPQFVFGGGWYTALYFTNTGASPAAFTVNFVSDTGTPLVVPSLNGSSVNVKLVAHSTAFIEAPNGGSLLEGYASFSLPAGVTGYGVFRHSVPGQPDQEAVVPLSNASATSTLLTWDENNLITGLGIVNPSTTANTVAVTVWDGAGNSLGTSSVALPAGNKTAVLLPSLPGLSGLTGKRGSAEFSVTSGSVAVLGLRADGSALTSIPTSAPQSGATASFITERALAQTGLAIGMASIVLQSQLNIAFAILERITYCDPLDGGGSVELVGSQVTVYYDSQCQKPYIATGAGTRETSVAGGIGLAETATYYGLNGSAIGSLTLNETALVGENDSFTVNGLGVFTAATSGATPVQLGLTCSLGQNSTVCAGGIAQDFPQLGVAIGSVSPLTLNVAGLNDAVTFTGSGDVVTGPIGSLTLTNPSTTSLVIQGGENYGAIAASGRAAAFSLFPPTPTDWSLTDSAHDQKFQISVVDNTTRNLSVTITQVSTGCTLATGSLDQSGTGTITWSDGTATAVTNWTLAD